MRAAQRLRGRTLSAAVGLGLIGLGLSACGGDDVATEGKGDGGDIVVGVDVPLTGAFAALGENLLNGYEFAVADINAAGGIDGRQLRLEVVDDTTEASVATNNVRKLAVQENVSAILGPYGSPLGIPVAAAAEQYEIPNIQPFSSDQTIIESDFEYLFNLHPMADEFNAPVTEYVIDQIKPTKVAVVYADYSWAATVAEQDKAAYGAAGIELMQQTITPGEASYSAALTKVKGFDPDMLQLHALGNDVVTLLNGVQQLKIDPPGLYVTGDQSFNPSTVDAIGAAMLDGVIGAPRWAPGSPYEAANEIAERYKEEFGNYPASETMKGYQAVQVLAAAIEDAGSDDPAEIREALADGTFDTLLGEVAFADNGQVTAETYVSQYQSPDLSKVVVLAPGDRATGDWVQHKNP
jgi:branched-chain amino acid transport system substrate-binding protein